jgi:hypothetical protein
VVDNDFLPFFFIFLHCLGGMPFVWLPPLLGLFESKGQKPLGEFGVSWSQRINKWQIVVSCDLPYFIACFSKQLYRVYLYRSLLAAQLNS